MGLIAPRCTFACITPIGRPALPVIDNLASGIAFLTAELQAAKAQSAELERQRDQRQAEAAGYQQQVACVPD